MKGRKESKDTRVYFLFVLPSILLFIFAIAYPFVSGINIAFTDWDGISKTYEYVGLKNFVKLFQDKSILRSIKNTLLFAFGYTAKIFLTCLSMLCCFVLILQYPYIFAALLP